MVFQVLTHHKNNILYIQKCHAVTFSAVVVNYSQWCWSLILLCILDLSHQGCQFDLVVIWALTSWRWVTACRVSMCIKGAFFKCSLPNRRSLGASFKQPVEVQGEHDEGNRALVLEKEPSLNFRMLNQSIWNLLCLKLMSNKHCCLLSIYLPEAEDDARL